MIRGSPPGASGYAAAVTDDGFLESLRDTELYSVGAAFADAHPELVDAVLAQADAIQAAGLQAYAEREDLDLEAAFQTLVTGLAVRYYRAIAG